MANYFIGQVINATQADGDDLIGLGDTLYIALNGGIISTASLGFNAIAASGDDESITLEGTVYSAQNAGVAISGASTSLIVDGSITGANAVLLTGADDRVSVGAAGRLSAHAQGLRIEGNSASPAVLQEQIANAGSISGNFGVLSQYAGASTIANTGTIQGTAAALLFAHEVGTDYVGNSGTLSGPTALASVSSSSGVSLTNTGHIVASGTGGSALTNNLFGALYFDDALGVTDYVSNTGDITASPANAAIYALFDNVVVDNAGKIVGGLAEFNGGVANVTNSGTWDTGGSAYGLSLGAAGSALNNIGAIIGNVSGAAGDDAITNTGSISGALTLSGSKGGDRVVNSGSLGSAALSSGLETFVNTSTGAVGGALTFGGVGHLSNSGRIGGDVSLGSGWTVNTGEIDGAFAGGAASLVNRGSISQGVSMYATGAKVNNTAAGTVGTAVILTADNVTLNNAGKIDGDVQLGASATFRNSGAISGDVSETSGTFINTGAIQGVFTTGDPSQFPFLYNYGFVGGMVLSQANLTNSIHGEIGYVTFQVDGIFQNAGVVDGAIQFGPNGGRLSNSGQVLGAVNLNGASGISSNTGSLNGGVQLASGATYVSNGSRGSIAGIFAAYGARASGFLLSNAGAITGGVLLQTGSDTVDNSGTLTGGLKFGQYGFSPNLGHDVLKNNARGVISGGVFFGWGDDTLTNAGVIDGGISTQLGGDVINNYGAISGFLDIEGYSADTFNNYKTINGDVKFGTHLTGTMTNSGVVNGALTVLASQHVTDLGKIQGDVTLGADDLLTLGRGSVIGAIHAAANDHITFAGLMGATTVAGFQSTDVFDFKTTVFADFNAVQHAMAQVGADVVITRTASDALTLQGVTMASLSSSNFVFS